MSIFLDDPHAIRLVGACSMGEAEILAELLSKYSGLPVDWSSCVSAHTAVIQVLFALKPVLRGEPQNQFLRAQLKGLKQATH